MESTFSIDGNLITVQGVLDGTGADGLETAMNADTIYTLDFAGVTDIRFSALRSLLGCRKAGVRFIIINACDKVAEKFEDTGVSAFVSVCRTPKPLDMSKYTAFGESFLSKAFNSEDGDSMIKVYDGRTPKEVVAREKATAKAVMLFGLPTPLVGTLYSDGNATGLDFERIEGKRSFARIIAEEPERLEEISIRFARMTRELHSTPCDTTVFNDRSMLYRQAFLNCEKITGEDKDKAIAFLDSVPARTTCLHGDLQIGNVITNEKEDLWIDLADFSYGNPMFDMGMWYFLTVLNTPERVQNQFHLSKEQIMRVWEVFVREYFGADTPEKQAAVVREIEPFAAIHMLYLGATFQFEPFLLEYFRAKIVKP